MAIHVVRLGTPGRPGVLRLGTVRRPPRGVPKAEHSRFYDLWLPELAPSEELLHAAHAADLDGPAWRRFARRYRAEMARPPASRLLDLLAALSTRTELAVGCYCADESRCHRSLLADLLRERGAEVI
jgi:uncharacterized protein YeaO (DUF488 family)